MTARQTARFVVVGVLAFALSTVVFAAAIRLWSGPTATLARWLVLLPVLYVGYSRWVLAEVRAEERARLGPRPAERRMLVRVAASVGASMAAKVVLEPLGAHLLKTRLGPGGALLSPILADFLYGPLANYVVLSLASRRAWR